MTVLGRATVDDLRDLIAAKDFTIKRIDEAFNRFLPTWGNRDPATANDWSADWAVFVQRYQRAHDVVELKGWLGMSPPIGSSVTPAGDEYEGILRALTEKPGGGYSKGDIQDLYNRLVAAQKAPVDFTGMPQPKNADPDLAYMNETGKIGEAAGGTVSDIAKGADSAIAKSSALDKYFLPVAVAAIGGVVAIVVAKKFVD